MISSCAHIVRMEYIYGLQSEKNICIFMTGTTGGAITAAVRTGNLSMRRSFLFPRTRQERRPFSTLISITSLPFTRPFWTVSLWSRIIRIIRTFWSRQGGSEAVNRTGSSGRCTIRFFPPEMHFCNASVRSGVPLTQLLSPSVPPYYGVIFLREERPLTPEVLTHWAETLSQPCRPAVFLHACTSSPAGRRRWSSLRMRCG